MVRPDGTLRSFSFSARKFADGTLKGELQLNSRSFDVVVHIKIDCLRVVGNVAHMSGRITRVSNPDEGEVGELNRVEVRDNGEGRKAPPDQVEHYPGQPRRCRPDHLRGPTDEHHHPDGAARERSGARLTRCARSRQTLGRIVVTGGQCAAPSGRRCRVSRKRAQLEARLLLRMESGMPARRLWTAAGAARRQGQRRFGSSRVKRGLGPCRPTAPRLRSCCSECRVVRAAPRRRRRRPTRGGIGARVHRADRLDRAGRPRLQTLSTATKRRRVRLSLGVRFTDVWSTLGSTALLRRSRRPTTGRWRPRCCRSQGRAASARPHSVRSPGTRYGP